MFGERLKGQDEESLKLLEELELNHPDEVEEKRIDKSFKIKSRCRVSPGNLSQRQDFVHEGSTLELSAKDLQSLLPAPLQVGDLFHVTFDREVLDLDPVVARCTRCRMLGEDSFETTLTFLQPVDFARGQGT